jgi:hypothetical protein
VARAIATISPPSDLSRRIASTCSTVTFLRASVRYTNGT